MLGQNTITSLMKRKSKNKLLSVYIYPLLYREGQIHNAYKVYIEINRFRYVSKSPGVRHGILYEIDVFRQLIVGIKSQNRRIIHS